MKKFLSLFMFVMCIALNVNAQNGTSGNLTWAINNKTLTISGTGAMENFKVSSHRAPWYDYRTTFDNVVIGDGVTSIGDNAFYYCDNMKTITIPATVSKVGIQSFAYCHGLRTMYWFGTNVEFTVNSNQSSSVTIDKVFYGIGNRANITLYHRVGANSAIWAGLVKAVQGEGSDIVWTINGSVLTLTGDNADFVYFEDWNDYRNQITTVELSGMNAVYNAPYIYSADGKTILFACKDKAKAVIPSGVTDIAYKAFYGLTNVTSVEIGVDVESIGNYAFDGCGNITSVKVFPIAAPTLGISSFDAISSYFTTLLITDGVEKSAYDSWVDYFSNVVQFVSSGDFAAGQGEWRVENDVLYIDGLASIPAYTPTGAPWLWSNPTKIVIGDKIIGIGENAFNGLGTVEEVVVGESVTTIAHYAFNNVYADYTFYNNPEVADMAIPESANKTLILNEKQRVDNNGYTYFSANNLMTGNNTFNSVKLVRELAANTSGTIMLPFDYINRSADVKFYYLSGYDKTNKQLKFEETDLLDAHKPYIWKATGTISELVSNSGNVQLISSDITYHDVKVGDWTMRGVYKETQARPTQEGTDSDLWIYASDGLFRNYSDYAWVDPYRAYFKGEKYSSMFSGSGNAINGFVEERSLSIEFIDKDGTTTIEHVTIDENGALDFDSEDAVYYDLSGRRVENPTKGLYIVNGKKVFIK